MDRLNELKEWLYDISAGMLQNLTPASADASFRQYFRVTSQTESKSYIVMDAPPDKEDCHPFVLITELLRDGGVHTPEIVTLNLEKGFILLEDLGNRPYLDHLNFDTADKLYLDAIDTLVKIQNIDTILPLYSEELLQTEMDLFETWYINRHLNLQLNDLQKTVLEKTFKYLVESAIEQPQVFVHRDYHSRNLMITDSDNPGVIDYQDAVIGPITYDLVSLFKDCYIEWPRLHVESWVEQYLARISPDTLIDKSTMLKWFDLMGVQRHLKVLGIFCRLNYRDNKPQYLDDLPLTFKYIIDTCDYYDELQPLKALLLDTQQA